MILKTLSEIKAEAATLAAFPVYSGPTLNGVPIFPLDREHEEQVEINGAESAEPDPEDAA